MGWLFGWGNRKDLIEHLTKGFESEKGKTVCLRKQAAGNVLWTLAETTNKATGEAEQWIGCCILQRSGGDWGYKDMDEACGPVYYTCPLAYLDAAPVANAEWRASVREHWARKREAAKFAKGLKPGALLETSSAVVEFIRTHGRTHCIAQVKRLLPMPESFRTNLNVGGVFRFKTTSLRPHVPEMKFLGVNDPAPLDAALANHSIEAR